MGSGASLRPALGGHRYALLTTFRRNGQPVATPVWFALADDKVYFRTSPRTGKAKRLRYNARVQIAPSTAGGRPLGPEVEGRAPRLGPEESGIARRALEQKYGLQVTTSGPGPAARSPSSSRSRPPHRPKTPPQEEGPRWGRLARLTRGRFRESGVVKRRSRPPHRRRTQGLHLDRRKRSHSQTSNVKDTRWRST
jgi:PPOX class probable F420-dependent enzyme